MARANNLIPNFTGGEINPRTAARRDLEGFYNSTEYQANFISDLQGGARFRQGTQVAGEVLGARMLPFIYDELDTYLIDVGNFVRVIGNNGLPKVRAPILANRWDVERVENRTDEIVFHVSGINYTNLVLSELYSFQFGFGYVGISPELDGPYHDYANGVIFPTDLAAINTSTINGAWSEVVVNKPGVVASAAVTPAQPMALFRNESFNAGYSTVELDRLQFTQKFDSMWLTVGTKPARQLVRTVIVGPSNTAGLTLSATTGTVTVTAGSSIFSANQVGLLIFAGSGVGVISAFSSGTSVTMQVLNAFASTSITAGTWGSTSEISFTFGLANIIRKQPAPAATLNLGATSGTSVSATASTATFQAGDIGGVIVAGNGRGLITAFINSTVVTINISTAFSSTSVGAGTWRVLDGDLMGGTTGNDPNKFPYCVTLYEERLWYAHTAEAPSRLWGSLTGRFSEFPPASSPILDTDTIRLTLAERSDDIIFMLPDKDLLYLGTLGGAVGVSSGSASVPINANSARARYLHNIGTIFGRPFFQHETDLYFVDRAGTGLWKVQYNFNTEKYVPELVTIAADHLTRSNFGIRRASVKTGDDGRIFLIMTSGAVLALTASTPYGIRAFSRHVSGSGAITDVCILPAPGVQDRVFFVIERDGRAVLCQQPDEVSNVIIQKEDLFYVGNTSQQLKANYENYAYSKGLASHLDASAQFDRIQFFGDLTLSATSGSGVTATSSGSVFSSGMVGRAITKLVAPGSFGVAEIVAYVSPTEVTVDVIQEFSNAFSPAGGWLISLASGSQLSLPSFYFKNQTVSVVVDGVVYDDIAVDDQCYVNVPAEGSVFNFGFKYKGLLKTVNMLGVGSLGTSEHLKKNIAYMGVNFFETGQGTSYGTDMFRLEPLDFRQQDDPTDRPPPLFTGEKRIRFDENWDKEKHIYVFHEGGTPCTVLSLIPFFNTSSD